MDRPMPELGKHRAVVTGASSGLGAEMARVLAARGCDLVITARREARLESLAQELRRAHGVDVLCVPADLTDAQGRRRLVDAAYDDGRDVDILINGAGFGDYTAFAAADASRQAALMQLNMSALVDLTREFLLRMRSRDRCGYVGNISSMLAYFAVPNFAVYAASKAFVRSFTEALHSELRGTPVSATCVCLGATDTEFLAVAGIRVGLWFRPFVMSPRRAARIAVDGILRRRRNVIPGVLNRLVALTTWLMPRRLMSWLATTLLGRPRSPALSAPEGTTRVD
jgi:short-subunit dehydrogenase